MARPAVLRMLAIWLLPISGTLRSNEGDPGMAQWLELGYALQERLLFHYLCQGKRRLVYDGTDRDCCLKRHPIAALGAMRFCRCFGPAT